MVLKKEGLFSLAIFLIVFFNLNFVEAGTLCADNQIILRLSSATNSHGEVWNGAGNYPVEICYDRIFGTTGSGSRTCTGANKVVGLSSTTNAHAEAPSQNNYATSVCYGNVSCVATTGSCGGNERLVLSLSSTTNAHLANDSSYSTKICCSVSAAPPPCTLNSASWDVIETVEGQVIDLEVITTNCQGLEISFEVKERDAFPGADDPVTRNPQNVFVALDGTAVGKWTAEWQAEGWPETDPPEYYFTATLVSTGANIQSSNELKVYQTTPPPCTDGSIVTCSSYGNQQDCQNDICSVADNSVPSSIDCTDPTKDCSCSWNTATTSCEASWTGSNPGAVCGNGVREAGEVCDGTQLDGRTCPSFGFSGGVLSCNSNCNGFITSACTGYSCNNNGIRDVGSEACDGTALGNFACTDFDEFTGGTLTCNANCDFNTSQCTGAPSGNDIGTCFYTEDSSDTCDDDGFLTLSWLTRWEWSSKNPGHNDPQGLQAQCLADNGRQESIECPAQIPLPFFTFWNLIAALVLIAIVYWAISMRKRRESSMLGQFKGKRKRKR